MLGIDDPLIWLAYIMCLLATALSIGYGLVRRNRADDKVTPEDRAWAKQEKRVEHDL